MFLLIEKMTGMVVAAAKPRCDAFCNWNGGFDRLVPVSGRPSLIAVTPWPVATLFLLALLIGAMVNSGRAVARDYGSVMMNFDLWCQEEAHLPVHRCDQRTVVDENAFENFQHAIGPFETQNLRRAQREQWLKQDFMENDPIDNPVMRNHLALTQSALLRSIAGGTISNFISIGVPKNHDGNIETPRHLATKQQWNSYAAALYNPRDHRPLSMPLWP
jgi:hypothetical protein